MDSSSPPKRGSIQEKLTRRKMSASGFDEEMKHLKGSGSDENLDNVNNELHSTSQLADTIRDGDMESLQQMLSKMGYGKKTRQKLNEMDANGYTLLCIAAKNDQSLIAEMLIEANADVSMYGNAALFMAARWGKNDVLSVLLNAKADVKATPQGVTALVVATRGNQVETAMLLIDSRSDVNAYSSQGKTVMNVAWESGFLDIVRILVSNGATLTESMWMEASLSPNLCFNLAEGLTERIGNLGRDDIPVITLPALYAWFASAPDACVRLLDIVLLKEITEGVPKRADLSGQQLKSVYTKDCVLSSKDQDRLCPPDTGGGCTVRVRRMEVKGILRARVLYAISTALSGQIFTSVTVEALIDMSFSNYIFYIFLRDVIIEVVLLLFFWVNLLALSNYQSTVYKISRLILMILVLIVTLRDTLLLGVIFLYGRTIRKGIWCNLRIGRVLCVIPNFVYIFAVLLTGDAFDFGTDLHLESNQPRYLPVVAIATFLRYGQLLNMSMESRFIGIKILPIFYALLQIFPFALLFFLILFAFIHALYVFYHDDILYKNVLEFAIRQVALGMVTRWAIFMNEFTADHPTLGDRYVWLVLWYLAASFGIIIILLQMFVGVLRTAYMDQKLLASATFLRKKSNTCFEYFLFRQRSINLGQIKDRILRIIGTFEEPPAKGVMWICETAEEKHGRVDDGGLGEDQQLFETLNKLGVDSTEVIHIMQERIQAIEKKFEGVLQKVYSGLSEEKRKKLMQKLSQGIERRTREDRQSFQLQKMGSRGKFSSSNVFGTGRRK